MPSVDTPCPIPYQGSKRKLAAAIVECFPDEFPRLYEPFVGSAAVSLATAAMRPEVQLSINDTNAALMALWREMIERPDEISAKYSSLWHEQLGHPREFYDEKRDEFNSTGRPDLFLYLLARCVKAAVRYNVRGEFNQSPDNRRLGSRPRRMARNIAATSRLLHGRTTLSAVDFREAVVGATPSDLIYLDPPYQGVSSNRDRRYANVLDYDDFVAALAELNRRNLSYIISYDGRTGDKAHGKPLPETLMLKHYEVDAGRSTQSTLSGGAARTIESIYLSPALTDRLGAVPDNLRAVGALP